MEPALLLYILDEVWNMLGDVFECLKGDDEEQFHGRSDYCYLARAGNRIEDSRYLPNAGALQVEVQVLLAGAIQYTTQPCSGLDPS